MVDLIRQFGPNGHGMLSEQQSETITDYSAYRSYWSEIAEEAILCQEQDPEIVLVYAHLTREYYAQLDEQQSPHEKAFSVRKSLTHAVDWKRHCRNWKIAERPRVRSMPA